MREWCNWLTRVPYKHESLGSSPSSRTKSIEGLRRYVPNRLLSQKCEKTSNLWIIYGECGGIGRHTGLWFRRRGIASSSLVTYPRLRASSRPRSRTPKRTRGATDRIQFRQSAPRQLRVRLGILWKSGRVVYGTVLERRRGQHLRKFESCFFLHIGVSVNGKPMLSKSMTPRSNRGTLAASGRNFRAITFTW